MDQKPLGINVKWCEVENEKLRKEGKVVDGQAEVDAMLARAVEELLTEHGLSSSRIPTDNESADFCRSINGRELRTIPDDAMRQCINTYGIYQVVALVANAIFMHDITLIVELNTNIEPAKITATWKHVI